MLLSPKQFLSELVKDNIITSELAEKYEIESIQKNMPIEEYLFQQPDVAKEEILKVKARILKVPYIDITSAAIDPHALSLLPETVSRRYNILPYYFDTEKDTVYIATNDPLNFNLAEFLEKKTGKKVVLSLAPVSDLLTALNTNYAQDLSPEVKEVLKEVVPEKAQTAKPADPTIREAPMAKIVNTILEFAVKSRASDIHIEPRETKTGVRYRIDGILEEKLSLPRSIHDSLVSRIKILAEMKIDEKRLPQDGRFGYKLGTDEIDLRISTLPTVNGEKVVMRLLKKSGGLPSLPDLGLRGTQLKDIEEVITKPYGIVLVTGPTGSGKTTTLYSMLTKLNKPSINILTIEDPVEYKLAGVNQVQVNVQAGLTFATGLRSFLRQDPNIILVGEIRDKDTTQLSVQAALTGHLVFSTLHTNNAATAIPRLIDLGGEPFLIASVLNASIAQRITRRICMACREFYDPPAEIKEDVKHVLGELIPKQFREDSALQLARGKGCTECNNTGYLGRIAIFEVLKITPVINKMILQESSAQEIETAAQKEGFMIMKQDGYLKALEGVTTIEEVLRVAEI